MVVSFGLISSRSRFGCLGTPQRSVSLDAALCWDRKDTKIPEMIC
jgi:hypothetical protein